MIVRSWLADLATTSSLIEPIDFRLSLFVAVDVAGTCSSAWYDDRTSGPDSTCRYPSASANSRSRPNSSGV